MGVKGVKEYFEKDLRYFYFIEDNIREVVGKLGYEEFRPSILAEESTFYRGMGEGSDIVVNKEMFYISDEEKKIVLRPEFTPLVAKTYVERGFAKTNPLWKLFYIGPCFRRERPQKGRLREFHQAGIEIVGDKNIVFTFELLLALKIIFSKLCIDNYTLSINSLGCFKKCRGNYLDYLKKELANKISNLCGICQERLKRNPLRILDCKKPVCKELLRKEIKPIRDFLCHDCNKDKSTLFNLLKENGISYIENEYLVRGFDYYTGIVFEYTHPTLGSQDAFCGGGRYDNLLNMFGENQPEGAVGCGLGIERTILILQQLKVNIERKSKPMVYIAFSDIELLKKNSELIEKLLNNDFCTFSDYSKSSLKAHLRRAENVGADYTIILLQEDKKEKIICRRMRDGYQVECTLTEVIRCLDTLK